MPKLQITKTTSHKLNTWGWALIKTCINAFIDPYITLSFERVNKVQIYDPLPSVSNECTAHSIPHLSYTGSL